MRSLAVALLLLFAWTTPAAADTIRDRFDEANGHYYKKRYAQARDGYQDLIDRYQIRNAVLYYNLGNAHYELKALGRALLNYKRALESEPEESLERRIRDNMDRSVEALIDRHRKDVGRSVTVLDETHGVLYSLFHLISNWWAGVVLAVFWVLLFGVLIARRLIGSPEVRRALRTAALSLAVPMLLALILFVGNIATTRAVERGIVVQDNVQMRDGRHPNAPASDVPEGLEVRIIDTMDPNETRIRLSNGKEGWVPAKSVEAL